MNSATIRIWDIKKWNFAVFLFQNAEYLKNVVVHRNASFEIHNSSIW